MYAQLFYQSGFSVVPLKLHSKQPLVKWSQYQLERAPEDVIKNWFSHQVNLGIVTGYSGLTVIDFDSPNEYLKWLNWITKQPIYSVAKRAFAVRSRRGVHVYFRLLQSVRNRHIGEIDIKGRFGLVTGPGSIHESGIVYEPLNDFYIPTVEALSDILPPALLLSDQTVSPVINVLGVPDIPSDPWEAAAQGYNAIPGEDLVDKIRKTFTIEQFFKTPLQKSGRHFYTTQCPFHDDQKPSFWINTEHQVCGCFVCNFPKPLDVINLYGLLYGLSNRDAILTLARLA